MMVVDKSLVRDVRTKCGGGRIHAAMQLTAAYEMAVARFNHPRTRSTEKSAIALEIVDLRAKLYEIFS